MDEKKLPAENKDINDTLSTLGNELKFPEPPPKKSFKANNKEIHSFFLKGVFVIILITIGSRIVFFINSEYADGEVVGFESKSRAFLRHPVIKFQLNGNQYQFLAAVNINLELKEPVKVIYKKNNPENAAVYSFFGFWFHYLLFSQVVMIFWTGITVAWFANY